MRGGEPACEARRRAWIFWSIWCWITVIACGSASPGQAQLATGPLGHIAPTREEVAPPPPPAAAEQAKPKLQVEGAMAREACPFSESGYDAVHITLTDVTFAHLRAVAPAVLRPAFEPYLGHEQPVSVICQIRDAAAAILEQRGYLVAVQIPPQKIKGGVLKLDVLMARLVAIRVHGSAGRSERLVAGYLERLKGGEAFNQNDAQRALLLVRDLPGFSVRLVLRPAGTIPGDVIGEVTVYRSTLDVDLNVQNFGTHDVGRWSGTLRGQIYGLTGLGDRTTISYLNTADFHEQRVVQLGHDFRVGHDGLTLAGRFTYAWTRPSLAASPNVKAHTLLASTEADYPFIRSETRNLRGAAGLEVIDQDVALGGATITRDHIRVAFLRIDGDLIDGASADNRGGYSLAQPRWRLGGALELRQGLAVLGATKTCRTTAQLCYAGSQVTPSRGEGDATATIVRFSGFAEFRPVPDITIAGASRFQYSARPLLSFEEYSAGNYTVGRGYDPGIISGDSGAGLQGELRYGDPAPHSTRDLAYQIYSFFDVAWTWNRDSDFKGRNPKYLYSAGAGVRAAFGDIVRIDVAIAEPLRRAGLGLGRRSPRLLASFTTKLWPWSRS